MAATATAFAPSFVVPNRVIASASKVPRIAVIDDDPMFGRIMEQLGRRAGVEIKYFEDFETLEGFDVAIIDYDLGSMTGVDISRHVEMFIGALPVILVSRSKISRDRSWPRCIKEFVYKGMGPWAILDAAIEAYGLSTIERNIKKIGRRTNGKVRSN